MEHDTGADRGRQACCDECARAERPAQAITLSFDRAKAAPAGKRPGSRPLAEQPRAAAPQGTARRPDGRSGRYPVTAWSTQRLYRPFVKWALIIGLTLGSAAGAGMLLSRAFGLEAGLWWLTHAQSHGVAQAFGFAGLFTMGIAFHVVPRFRNGSTIFPWPQRMTLLLVATGVAMRTVGQSIEDAPAVTSPILVISGIAILAGVLIFAATTAYTLRTGPSKHGPAEWWIGAGTAWAVTAAGLHLAITIRMAVDSTVIGYGPWDRALIAAGLQGFIMCFIFGVSVRAVGGFLGLRRLLSPLERAALVALNAGLAWSIATQLAGTSAAVSAWGALLNTAGIAMFVASLRVFEPSQAARPMMAGTYRRYPVFIRLAYLWLAVFAALQAVTAVETIARTDILPAPVSSPVIHVLTLGFITGMIMGMGARMLPLFEGSIITRHRSLDVALIALTASVALRLAFGYMRSGADAWLGVSGTLGLVALAFFAWGVLGGHRPMQAAPLPFHTGTAPVRQAQGKRGAPQITRGPSSPGRGPSGTPRPPASARSS